MTREEFGEYYINQMGGSTPDTRLSQADGLIYVNDTAVLKIFPCECGFYGCQGWRAGDPLRGES